MDTQTVCLLLLPKKEFEEPWFCYFVLGILIFLINEFCHNFSIFLYDTAMMLSEPSAVFSWIYITCERPYLHSSFICEMENVKARSLFWKGFTALLDCSLNWLLLEETCIMLHVLPSNQYASFSTPGHACKVAVLSKEMRMSVENNNNLEAIEAQVSGFIYKNMKTVFVKRFWGPSSFAKKNAYIIDHITVYNIAVTMKVQLVNTSLQYATLTPERFLWDINEWHIHSIMYMGDFRTYP